MGNWGLIQITVTWLGNSWQVKVVPVSCDFVDPMQRRGLNTVCGPGHKWGC